VNISMSDLLLQVLLIYCLHML